MYLLLHKIAFNGKIQFLPWGLSSWWLEVHSCSLSFSSFPISLVQPFSSPRLCPAQEGLASRELPVHSEDFLWTDIGAQITVSRQISLSEKFWLTNWSNWLIRRDFVANAIRCPAIPFQQGGALLRLASPCNQGYHEDRGEASNQHHQSIPSSFQIHQLHLDHVTQTAKPSETAPSHALF